MAARYGASVRALTVLNPVPEGLSCWEAFDPIWGTAIELAGRAANERLQWIHGVDGSRCPLLVPPRPAAVGHEQDEE